MKINKKVAIGLLAAGMLTLTACGTDAPADAAADTEARYQDGAYTATSQGFNGDVEIEVVIEEGKITELNVLSHDESPGISDGAFEGIEEQLLEKQEAEELDAVTQATATSNALIEAITEALAEAENK
ncbi:MAG: FMN-binding protein [Clostridiaceae bacterium]|nr:FMN-binding protein [Clostridiaceae bacterium]